MRVLGFSAIIHNPAWCAEEVMFDHRPAAGFLLFCSKLPRELALIRSAAFRSNVVLLALLFTSMVASLAQSAAPSVSGSNLFLEAPEYSSGGDNAFGVAVADLNGDGNPGAVIANGCSGCGHDGTVSVLLGNGNGTFQPPVSYDAGGVGAFLVLIGDFNSDGKLDLLVRNTCATTACTSSSFGLLLGNGDGTFQPVTVHCLGLFQPSVAVDVNGDGKLDLVGFNGCKTTNCANLSVLLGNGDGTFQPAVNYNSGGTAYGGAPNLVVADVNDDGKLDILVANNCASGDLYYCNMNQGNGSVGVLEPVAGGSDRDVHRRGCRTEWGGSHGYGDVQYQPEQTSDGGSGERAGRLQLEVQPERSANCDRRLLRG
jgi:hypothetical protein